MSTTLAFVCIALSPALSGRAAAQTPPVTSPTAQAAQSTDPNATLNLTGCLIKESDYRRAHQLGEGALKGVGLGDEFVLVDTTPAAGSVQAPAGRPAKPTATGSPCREAGTGPAYRITGHLEDELKAFAGHRLQVTGKFEHASDAQAAANPSAAKLPAEINISAYQEATATAAAAGRTATAQTSSQSAAPASVQARNEPQSRRGDLPRTASQRPLVLLVGVLMLFAAVMLRLARTASV